VKLVPLVVCLSLVSAVGAQIQVFSTDFNTTMPAAIAPGTALLEGVQGYAGLGPVGNQFGGTFLRSETGNVVTLTLTGLPAHNALSIGFLFAAIDSLDGSGTYPSGDYFKITLDGNAIFRESFANASPAQFQSYVPPPGGELARHIDLGFSGPGSYYTDSAYDFAIEPATQFLAHTASTATITFQIEGAGIQGLADESWGMDNLRVTVTTGGAGNASPYGLSCGPVIQLNTAAPRIGQPMTLTLASLPSATTFAITMLGTSNTVFGALPLPLPLDNSGLPGCTLLQNLAIGLYSMNLQGGTATAVVPVPNDPNLLALRVFAQGIAVVPGSNAGGMLLSGGLRIVVGS